MSRPQRRPERPDPSIEALITRFIVQKRPDWNGETERTYRKSLDTFESFADENDLENASDLTLWAVGHYNDWLLAHARGYAKVTVLSKQKQARTMLKWAESQGLVERGAHLAIDPIKLDDDEQTSSDILRPDRLKTILEYYRHSTKWRGTRRHALLEVIAHIGARRIGIRALDLDDWDPEERTLKFIDRDGRDTRLKRGQLHERKVVLSEEPAKVLEEYVARDRHDKHDDHGREPLFTSRQGRPTRTTITDWCYAATLPCIYQDCPHSREPHKCEWASKQTKASQCPSSKSAHPIRRGSITWQLNIGRSIEDVADRAGTTPGVIRRYYDQPDLDEDLRRRISHFDAIDITEHQVPSDIDDEL